MNVYDKAKLKRLTNAIEDADRFAKRARLALSKLASGEEDFSYSKSFASAKRASLDLSRSLSILRRHFVWVEEKR